MLTPELQPLADDCLRLIRERVSKDRIVDRSQQYWDQMQFDNYFRGVQNSGYIDNVQGRLQFIPYSLESADRFSDVDGAPPADYNFNLYRRGVRMMTALFGVRSPTTKVEPINPRNQHHVAVARKAQRINNSLNVVLDPESIQTYLAFLTAKAGTVFGYTRWVSSEEFGTTFIPDLVSQSFSLAPPAFECRTCGSGGFSEDLDDSHSCPYCGSADLDMDEGLSLGLDMPDPSGAGVDVRNGSVVCSLHTLASVAIPSGYRDLAKCPWVALVEEVDVGLLSRTYDIPVSQISAFSRLDLNEFSGVQARSAITSYDGRGLEGYGQAKATRGIYWIEPSNYGMLGSDFQGMADAHFKTGVKLTILGGKAIRIEHESHTEVLTACLPEESETLAAQPYLADTIPMSDIYNDSMEIAVEAAQHSIPVNLFDTDIVSAQDLRRHGRAHATFIPSKQRSRSLKGAIESFRPSEFRPEMISLAQEIFAKSDEFQGLLPIIWGSVAGAETAYETSSAKNQALAMLAVPWVKHRKFHQGVRRQAIQQVAKYSDGRLHLPVSLYPAPSNVVEIASLEDLEEIREGGWHVTSDENMPLSAGQIRDSLHQLLRESSPETIQALGLMHPVNLPSFMSALGLPGFRSPLMEQVESVNVLLQKLLGAQPIQTPEGQTMPSEQLDDYLYDPSLVIEIMKPWLVSDEGRSEQEMNPGGWVNVRLYAQMAEQILQQKQMQQQQQQGPPPQEGPPQGPQPGPPQQAPEPSGVPAGQ